MFVRTAGERDLKAVRDLLVESCHAAYDDIYGAGKVAGILDGLHSIPALRARLEKPGSEFVLADDGSAIAGMAFARLDDDGRTAVLEHLHVLPAMQGRGIGGVLLDEIEGAFPEAETVRLEVEEGNRRAVAFFIGQGFSETGLRQDDEIAILMFERPIVWADG